MNTWTDWAGKAALPYLLRAHTAPRALLIHAGAEADAILAAAADALALGVAGVIEGGRDEDRAAFGRDAALDLDLMPFDGCAAVAVPWTPDAPQPARMIHAALEAALRSTRSATQPVLVRVDAAALPAAAAGVDVVAAALPDFTQARLILSTVNTGTLPTLAGFPLPRDPAEARRVLPLLLGAARLASDAPAALFHVQVRVPSSILATRGDPFPRAAVVDPTAPPLRCHGKEVRLSRPRRNPAERATTRPESRTAHLPPPTPPARSRPVPGPAKGPERN